MKKSKPKLVGRPRGPITLDHIKDTMRDMVANGELPIVTKVARELGIDRETVAHRLDEGPRRAAKPDKGRWLMLKQYKQQYGRTARLPVTYEQIQREMKQMVEDGHIPSWPVLSRRLAIPAVTLKRRWKEGETSDER